MARQLRRRNIHPAWSGISEAGGVPLDKPLASVPRLRVSEKRGHVGAFRLPPDDIQTAVRYIETHLDQVLADYQEIVQRHRSFEYPAEVKDRLRETRERFQAKLAELWATKASEPQHAANHRGS
jgi:hypothetical protein